MKFWKSIAGAHGNLFAVVLFFLALNVPTFAGRPVRGNLDYTGVVNFEGELEIGGTKVNSTAAELNQMNTGTQAVERLNAKTAGDYIELNTNIVINGWTTYSVASLAVTNGQAISVSARNMLLLPSDASATCTVTTVSSSGREVNFTVGNGNEVVFTDDNGTLNLQQTRTVQTNDVLNMWSGTGPNKWVEGFFSDN